MKKLRILYVEDDGALAEMYATGLRMAGHEVAIAHRGARAVELATSTRFDYLLVDFHLPDLTGLEVVEELDGLRAMPALAAVLSSLEDDWQRERARRLGIDQWLVKSRTTPRALVAAIEEQVRLAQPVASETESGARSSWQVSRGEPGCR